jgi:hypothetical protein
VSKIGRPTYLAAHSHSRAKDATETRARTHTHTHTHTQKRVTFTYTSNYIHTAVKLLKNGLVKIALKTVTTIKSCSIQNQKQNNTKTQAYADLHMQDAKKSCIGQTGRAVKVGYKEHIRSIRNNKEETAYATHFLNNRHQYGKIDDIMNILDHAKRPNNEH